MWTHTAPGWSLVSGSPYSHCDAERATPVIQVKKMSQTYFLPRNVEYCTRGQQSRVTCQINPRDQTLLGYDARTVTHGRRVHPQKFQLIQEGRKT